MKKVFHKNLLTLFCLLLSISGYAHDFEMDGIFYKILSEEDHTVSVTFKGESIPYSNEYSGDIVIPKTVSYNGQGYAVVKIDSYAFIQSETLNSIYIPGSVKSVGSQAFSECTQLTGVTIEEGVEELKDYAFYGCSSLQQLEIPSNIKIGRNAFRGCTALPTEDGLLYIGDYLIQAFDKERTTYIIKDGTKFIDAYAFSTFSSLEEVSFPYTLESIGDGAFYECTSINSVVIPESVSQIGIQAFFGCTALQDVVLPNSITVLDAVFQKCTSLTAIDLPKKIKSLAGIFNGCTSLSSIVIPNSVENITGAFYGCTSLVDVSLPKNIQVIGSSAFRGCANLESVIMPECIKEIESTAFYGCNKLNSVTIFAKTPPTIANLSFSVYGTLHVVKGCKELYGNKNYWKQFTIEEDAPDIYELVDDLNAYSVKETTSCEQLIYTRAFTNTTWNALYVPFAMSYDDWSDDFEIARLNDVHQFDDDEDGVVDRTVLEVIKLMAGSTTEPNTPYMIKAKEVGEKSITLTNATLYATEESSFDVTSWFATFTFTGTYSTITDMATKGHYAMANGGLMQASSDAATLGAFRWYLDITDRNGNPAPLKANSVFLSFDDGETTEIKIVEANTYSNDNAIYTISGTNVGNNKAALPKGLYINNGKKIIIK